MGKAAPQGNKPRALGIGIQRLGIEQNRRGTAVETGTSSGGSVNGEFG